MRSYPQLLTQTGGSTGSAKSSHRSIVIVRRLFPGTARQGGEQWHRRVGFAIQLSRTILPLKVRRYLLQLDSISLGIFSRMHEPIPSHGP